MRTQLYTARTYVVFVKAWMFVVVAIPIISSSNLHFTRNRLYFLALEVTSMVVFLLDLVLKNLAMGYIISPRTKCTYKRRESMFSTMTLVCVVMLGFSIVSERLFLNNFPLLKIFRPLLIIARGEELILLIAG